MDSIKNNIQLQAFLTEYAKGNTLIADNGIIEEIEQSNQHFTLTITHEVLTSDIVQFITFKQHENYTQGDEYNELSDVFDYDNVFSVTMADGEVIEVEEKTNEKVENNMTNIQLEKLVNKYQGKLYFYNGFSEPKLIDLKDFAINSNYQGDVTEELKEGLFEYLTENDEGIQEEQPFFNYCIWFKPTLKNLQEFNLEVGLNKDDYLEKMVQEDNLNKTTLLDNGIWYYEHQNELNEAVDELEENPDFELFTVAKDLEQIVEEFEYQGINIDNLVEMTTNHYGNIVEIIFNHVNNEYLVYIGAR